MAAPQATVIWKEVNAVLSSQAKPVFFTLEATVHANGKDIQALYVIDEHQDGNYIEKHTDDISILLTFPMGQYNQLIQPYQEDLELTLRKMPYQESQTPKDDKNQKILSYRYQAHIFDPKSYTKEGNNPSAYDPNIADRTEMVTIRFQLLNPVYEQLRTQSFGSVLQDCTGPDAIVAILGKYSVTPHVDSAVTIKGVTVWPGANKQVRAHIPVPHMTPILMIPDVIDRECGGVYSTGMAFFLRNQYWFVGAPYDTTRFDSSKNTLTLINVPANRVVSPERSYRQTPTQTIILITGEVKHHSTKEKTQKNLGNGVRFIDATKPMEGWGTTGNNKLVVDAGKNVNEISLGKRADGFDYTPESENRITANPMNEYSKLAQRNGDRIQLVWENSNDSILYPYMPVQLIYLEDQSASAVNGVLIGCETYTSCNTKSVSKRRFSSSSTLTIFIDATEDNA